MYAYTTIISIIIYVIPPKPILHKVQWILIRLNPRPLTAQVSHVSLKDSKSPDIVITICVTIVTFNDYG